MISVDREDGIWWVRLKRPEKANALTGEMLEALTDIAEEAAGAARVLVLTGEGRVFSAGADLVAARAGLAVSPVWERLSGAIAAHPGLTIAALNGTVAGGAMGMALACDLRIGVPGCKVFYPVMKLGFLPQPSDPVRLRALVGPARTRLLLMGGAKWSADEALAFGFLDRIVPGEDLETTVRALASDTLAASGEIARGIKAMTL